MNPAHRSYRRQLASQAAVLRLLAAIVLTGLLHGAALGAWILVALLAPERPRKLAEPKVALVEVPKDRWDALMGGPPSARKASPSAPKPATPLPPLAKPEEKKAPEQSPGQVVDTAPGNREESPDARLAAETANKVDRETVARERRADAKAVTPRESTAIRPPESRPGASREQKKVALGSPDEDGKDSKPKKDGEFGSKLELPSLIQKEKLALKLDPNGAGSFANRDATDELRGNSKRFRVQQGEGEGDDPDASTGGPKGSRDVASLVPSAAVLDRISGAPAPDHLEGVDEGDATFLNTKEWKYASFFNRIKSGVANHWDPGSALRRRDPTGEIYAWKDRYTIVGVTLREDGRLKDIFVEKSSGVDFLDQEAIAAFERAQPFPNPPSGLLDRTDEIHFSFGFYLETARPSLKLFRGP